MKPISILLSLSSLLFCCYCSSPEKTAFKAAKDSNDLSQIRAFLQEFDGQIPNKHIMEIEYLVETLELDSTWYTPFSDSDELVEKYKAAMDYDMNMKEGIHSNEVQAFLTDENNVKKYNEADSLRYLALDATPASHRLYIMWEKYITDFPNGKHVDEGKRYLEHNKKVHDEMVKTINEFSHYFKRYYYQREREGRWYKMDFSVPDEFGEGTVKMTGFSDSNQWTKYSIADYSKSKIIIKKNNGKEKLEIDVYEDSIFLNRGGGDGFFYYAELR